MLSHKATKAESGPAYSIAWKSRISDIDRSAWDALALPLKTPLLEWEWLHLLEDSGSVRAETGWLPVHLTVWSGDRLVGAAPLYAKGHSDGEFVFDHAWAHLAQRLGIRYYPKLVGMSPFSPVVGYRFLIDPSADAAQVTRLMVNAIDSFCYTNKIVGCSFLFVDPDWKAQMESLGFIAWRHQSYAWKNKGFHSFEDYLAIFNTNQRRNIRRERRTTERAGITIKPLTGAEIPRQFFPLMYTYYSRTNDQYGPWGCKYLTKAFFEGLHHRFRHRLLLMAAFDGPENELPVGLSFLLTKNDRLYGRYWGCARKINHLHFNACYYSPIDWAIRHGVGLFDPGAGSPHKVRRGFEAVANHSLHRFYDPSLAQILREHIDEINRQEQRIIEDLNAALPFSKVPRK
ncbi:MAG: GNAT family N-acetyltransferase [Desulfobacterales bacterium]